MESRSSLVTLGTLLIIGLAGPAMAAGDATAGEAVFKSKCAPCHSLTPGLSTVAPDLRGVVGRAAGSLKGYEYSSALRQSNFSWTAEKLDAWLTSPHKVASGTEMAFAGLKDAHDRANVIEFLKHQKPQ